jgi:dTMP kinase
MIVQRRGNFIVFEGIDCSGTSTQAQLLTTGLRREGRRVLLTSEPSHGPVGQLIRSYFSERISSSFNRSAQDKFFGCLFAADRLDHIFNPVDGVAKQLGEGIDVVCTRYKFSSLAYNAETEEERSFVSAANSELISPDVLIYLRCPLDVALGRMHERVTKETYEKDRHKLENALLNFEREIGLFQGPKLVLDASRFPDQLATDVFRFVKSIQCSPDSDSGSTEMSA